ncbi:phosphoribosyltransferase [Chitinophaga flava]|uniref:Phosphoribosyltransferase n=1 Tax=Chitinophaga flava TaxID=2259036 RepID=A0A365XPS7_9BACT|nr:phosphoribosyltransferase family protein [Chitinophaga flava]RBL88349.1 phosphoribosyltransferase [Chitinophaga flava]
MYFIDRYDAAMQLADKLEKYKGETGVVLAVPRGGVPIGYYLAKHLDFALDLLMAKKIGHPLHEEYAIGAVGLEDAFIDEKDNIPNEYLKAQIDLIRFELKERYKRFMNREEPVDISGKTAIVIDDGIATGRTILVTLRMLRNKHPKKLVVAVPVSSQEAAERIKREVDEFICLYMPVPFYAVGRFYENFRQIDDEEVMTLLRELNERDRQAE